MVQHFWRWSGNIAAMSSKKNAAVEAPAQCCVLKGKVTSSELFFPNPLCWASRLPLAHNPERTELLLETRATHEQHHAYTFLSGLPFAGQHLPAQRLRAFQILSTFTSHITSANFSMLLIFTFKCFTRFWSKDPTSFLRCEPVSRCEPLPYKPLSTTEDLLDYYYYYYYSWEHS